MKPGRLGAWAAIRRKLQHACRGAVRRPCHYRMTPLAGQVAYGEGVRARSFHHLRSGMPRMSELVAVASRAEVEVASVLAMKETPPLGYCPRRRCFRMVAAILSFLAAVASVAKAVATAAVAIRDAFVAIRLIAA